MAWLGIIVNPYTKLCLNSIAWCDTTIRYAFRDSCVYL